MLEKKTSLSSVLKTPAFFPSRLPHMITIFQLKGVRFFTTRHNSGNYQISNNMFAVASCNEVESCHSSHHHHYHQNKSKVCSSTGANDWIYWTSSSLLKQERIATCFNKTSSCSLINIKNLYKLYILVNPSATR